MKRTMPCQAAVFKRGIAMAFGLVLVATVAYADDMREGSVQARQARQAMMEKAAAEQRTAEQAANASRALIARDRSALEKALRTQELQNTDLKQQVAALSGDLHHLEKTETAVSERLAASDGMIRELVGVIRVTAKDLGALIDQNLQTALMAVETERLRAIAEQSQFPGMADIRKMATALIAATIASGHVSLTHGPITDRSGRQIEAEILALGNFTAAYRIEGEVGYLTCSPAGHQLYALSRLPPARMRKQIAAYMDGDSEAVPMDVSRGGALNQLTHAVSLWQQIPKGGPIVWPILALLAIGVAIIVERVFFLYRKPLDGDSLMHRIATTAAERKWEECLAVCRQQVGKPVARVVAAGLGCRTLQREEMENVLQEAILKEVPDMERFLSTLGMLAAIAPLLGLLGTVTGMINTFHVITQHGTGDPRMMSGGISEALVTTMLGLCVAIPLMLAHTLLNRSVDNHIGQMEEKALTLINIVHRHRQASQG